MAQFTSLVVSYGKNVLRSRPRDDDDFGFSGGCQHLNQIPNALVLTNQKATTTPSSPF